MSEQAIRGLADLVRAMQGLPDKLQTNVLRSALRAGAKVIATEAKANINSVSGALAASVSYGSSRDKSTGQPTAYVRAGRRGKGKNLAFYAHMVEFGTAAHLIKAPPGARLNVRGVFYRSVQHPGARKHPFLLPAMDSRGHAALQAIADAMRKRLATRHGIDVPAPLESGADPE